MSKHRNNLMGGFTIIETMIAVSLFVAISISGMGALLNANLLYQKSQDMRSLIDNLNFVMEDMSRNIRTGYNYHCFPVGFSIPGSTDPELSVPKSCPAGGWAMAFEYAYGDNTDADVPVPDPIDYDDQWVYRIDEDGKIFKSTQGPYTESSFVQLTPDEVYIDPVLSSFVVSGAEAPTGDTMQPRVTIRLVGSITYHDVVSPFSMQTTVSQRLLDR